MREAEEWIHHFHLHDRRGRVDHLGLGQGGIDLKALAPYLARKPVILEIPQTSEEGFVLELEMAQKLIRSGGGTQ